MSMGRGEVVGPHPYGGEPAADKALTASVNLNQPHESKCIVQLLAERQPKTFSAMAELASRHVVRRDDDTSERHTTTWWCPAENGCHSTATVVFDPSTDDERVLAYEFPSKIPAIPGLCAEDASREIQVGLVGD